jgi:hypothetical protein
VQIVTNAAKMKEIQNTQKMRLESIKKGQDDLLQIKNERDGLANTRKYASRFPFLLFIYLFYLSFNNLGICGNNKTTWRIKQPKLGKQ